MRATSSLAGIAIALLAVAACRDVDPTSASSPNAPKSASLAVNADEGALYSPVLDEVNQSLAAAGVKNVRIARADISVKYGHEGWDGATTLIANNRTHTLSSQFVARDPRRRDGSAEITYLVDQSDGFPLQFNSAGVVVVVPNTVTEPAIDASMLFWQTEPRCGAPTVVKVVDGGADPDLLDGIRLGDPTRIGTNFADITHAGWLTAAFFNTLAPGGANFILGVTATFIFVDDVTGAPTDIDRNGRLDVAFREIYYNRSFGWEASATHPFNVDIQSVGTHEAGHAYGLGHFGKVFEGNNGVIKYAPRAIMNAVYISPFRTMTGTDNGSFCQIWASAK